VPLQKQVGNEMVMADINYYVEAYGVVKINLQLFHCSFKP